MMLCQVCSRLTTGGETGSTCGASSCCVSASEVSWSLGSNGSDGGADFSGMGDGGVGEALETDGEVGEEEAREGRGDGEGRSAKATGGWGAIAEGNNPIRVTSSQSRG